MTPYAYGLHFVDYQYDDASWGGNAAWIERLKPGAVNFLGAAQYEQALARALDTKQRYPGMIVIFRHYRPLDPSRPPGDDNPATDDGRHTRVSPQGFIDAIGSLYAGTGLHVLPDNESMADDLTAYGEWHREVMRLGARNDILIAGGRFSTHNPRDDQFRQLDALYRALHDYPQHILSPNVYFDRQNDDGWRKILLHLDRCRELNLRTPRIVIGEYGYAHDLDPHKGYRAPESGMSDEAYLGILKAHYGRFQASSFYACLYCKGQWPIGRESFGVTNELLQGLAAHAAEAASEAGGEARRVRFTHKQNKPSHVNLRAQPTAASADLGDVLDGEIITWYEEQNGWARVRNKDGVRGFMSTLGGLVVFEAIAAPPAPGDVQARVTALEKQNIAQQTELVQLRTALRALIDLYQETWTRTIPHHTQQIGVAQEIAERAKVIKDQLA